MNNALVLENIGKDYQQGSSVVEVLLGVNLTVKQGELVAIVGQSGSGKSTLLHIAGLLDEPTRGEVVVGGINSKIHKEEHLLRLRYLGFVYQYHHLLKDFTARENVAMPRLINGCDHQIAFDEADDLLGRLGLSKRVHNMPGELSGGEQQRVAIARSLINKPQLILADEPTGNLDPNTTSEVFDLFLTVARSFGSAIVMVTHNHILAKKMDICYELQNGVLKQTVSFYP